MTVTIEGRGTALPVGGMSQSQAADLAERLCCSDARERRLLRAIFRQTGIERRGSVLAGRGADSGAEVSAFYPAPKSPEDAGPTVRERMAAYHDHAVPLAAGAARRALARADVDPERVGQLVAVSCTGMGSPGVEIGLVEALGLAPDTGRTMVGFMGCHGALNGLRVARALAAAEPDQPVLLCAVELCSLHFQYRRDQGQDVANALFSDGAAALLLCGDRGDDAAGPRVRACGTCLLPDSAEDMTWRIGDHGFEMTLSPQVPARIERELAPWLRQWLAAQGLAIGDVGSWAIHPGGPQVLDAVCASLGLPRSAAEPSRQVLTEAGNMSSPTVLFTLEELDKRGAPGPTVLLAFGPGLVVEAALLE